MPIDSKLLEILRCPVTKQSLSMLSSDQLHRLNTRIAAGAVSYADGEMVESELMEGLITESGSIIYRIDSDIPVMLEERSIPGAEIEAT